MLYLMPKIKNIHGNMLPWIFLSEIETNAKNYIIITLTSILAKANMNHILYPI